MKEARTVEQVVNEIVNNCDMGIDDIRKIIATAYYMGREAAAREICDDAHKIFEDQKSRAEECRYYNLAKQIQGGVSIIYSPDYAGDVTNTFGKDRTNVEI
jgi:DNA-directed RNA polymerase delta subunit